MKTMLVLACAAVGLAALAGCSGDAPEHGLRKSNAPLTNAEEVAAIFSSVPSWAETAPGYADRIDFDEEDLDAYELAAIKLQGYSVSDIADGIELALDDAYGMIAEEVVNANIFVLLRIMYDVPVTVARTSVSVHAPYTGGKIVLDGGLGASPPTNYPLRWPVSFDAYNQVTGIDHFRIASGGGYAPLEEFLWLEGAYSQRNLPSCVGRCGNYDSGKICQCDVWCETYEDCCVDHDYTCGSSFMRGPSSREPPG